jgi:hypothetical protein
MKETVMYCKASATMPATIVFFLCFSTAVLAAPKPELWPKWFGGGSDKVLDYFLRHDIGGPMKQLVLNQSVEVATSDSSEDIAQQLKSRMDNLKFNFYDMERGGVNYESMKHSSAFKDYISATKALTLFDLNTLTSREAKLAFWINIYNALVVHGILTLNIKKSIKEVSSFFNMVCYNVGSHIFSLDDIEHGILRGNKKKHLLSRRPFPDSDPRKRFIVEEVDPRIHFALVCGSNSCPPIDVYEASEIDEQLEVVTSGFINSD